MENPKKSFRNLCTLWFFGWTKSASRTKKIRVLWQNGVNPYIYHISPTNYSQNNIFTAYRYPRVPERVPRYPNMVPWDQKCLVLNLFIKLWETFVLYIFHTSKLFWKNHATYHQKKIHHGATPYFIFSAFQGFHPI